MPSYLAYQNSEALRCADKQDAANSQLSDADHVTDGLDKQLHKTYGSSSSPICDNINTAVRARTAAIDAMRQLSDRLVQFCRTADTAYQDIDQQTAENLNQQLASG